MALHGRPDKEERLETWESVRAYATGKDKSVRWSPCTRGMRVSADKFIQTEDRKPFDVSDSGWAALCQALSCDRGTLRAISSPGLATNVLNDAWDRMEYTMMLRRLVVDARTVVGVVGHRYQPYKHGQLVERVGELLDKRSDNGWGGVDQGWKEMAGSRAIAHAIGTDLRITLPLERIEHCTDIEGAGGRRKDVSWIGVEARNGLSGGSSVGVRTTVYRLVCANGMVRPAADSYQRVSHIGEARQLDDKVKGILERSTKDLSGTVKWLETLGSTEFSTRDLADDRESVRLVRQMLKDLKDLDPKPKWIRMLGTSDKGKRSAALGEITEGMAGRRSGAVWNSQYRSNASLWDFVNIFTEAAQYCKNLGQQMRVEEGAGRLAERLVQTRSDNRPKNGSPSQA